MERKTQLSNGNLKAKANKYRALIKTADAGNQVIRGFRAHLADKSPMTNVGNCNSASRALLNRAASIRIDKTFAALQEDDKYEATEVSTDTVSSWAHGTDFETPMWDPLKNRT